MKTEMNKKVFLIAEIAQAHDGSLGIAHSYIDALAKTGVDAIKFQTHVAEAESSEYEEFRVKFSYEDNSRFDYWKRMEFTLDQWHGLKNHCEDVGVEFISSPFSCAAVDLLEQVEVKRYKIGSGEVNNRLMIERICRTGKPIMLSSGMSSYEELDLATGWISSFGNDYTIFQCTTAYPTKPDEWGLNIINEMQKRYEVPIGFSDHSGDIYAGLSAVSLGAQLLEFHAVFHKELFGPDTKASLDIDQVRKLVDGVRQIEASLHADIEKDDNLVYRDLKTMFGKSLCVNKNLKKGEQITIGDLEAKKPKGKGIDPMDYKDVVDGILTRDLNKWDFINIEDINYL